MKRAGYKRVYDQRRQLKGMTTAALDPKLAKSKMVLM